MVLLCCDCLTIEQLYTKYFSQLNINGLLCSIVASVTSIDDGVKLWKFYAQNEGKAHCFTVNESHL